MTKYRVLDVDRDSACLIEDENGELEITELDVGAVYVHGLNEDGSFNFEVWRIATKKEVTELSKDDCSVGLLERTIGTFAIYESEEQFNSGDEDTVIWYNNF